MRTFWSNLLQSVRGMRRNYLFAGTAVLTLALGIGANTAIFSVIHTVLFRPLPYKNPDRLVMVWEFDKIRAAPGLTSALEADRYLEQDAGFEQLAAFREVNYTWTDGDIATLASGCLVSADFFPMMGVAPIMGRTFAPDEDRLGNEQVVVLSYAYWQRLGADPDIIGKTLELNMGVEYGPFESRGRSFTVVGVMPRSFNFPLDNEIWAPLALDLSRYRHEHFANHYLFLVARLKEGKTLVQSQEEMAARVSQLDEEYRHNSERGAQVVGLHEQLVGETRTELLLLFAGVAFVLLLACATVANLMLARAVAREREVAIRAVFGADRKRLMGQLLTESLTIALCGGLVGLLPALWASRLIITFLPEVAFRAGELGLDLRILGFTVIVSLLTGVIFGLAPAIQSSKLDINRILKQGGMNVSSASRHQRTRRMIVVGEVALAVALLIGAGLMIRSLQRLQQQDLGFDPAGILTVEIKLPRSMAHQEAAFFQKVLERIKASPEVEAAGAITYLPSSRTNPSTRFVIEGAGSGDLDEVPRASWRAVSPDYFQTMKIGLLAGRHFTVQDWEGRPGVAIISESLARRYWADEDPIGRRIQPGNPQQVNPAFTIVGVVEDVRSVDPNVDSYPMLYLPFYQRPRISMHLVVRTAMSAPLELADDIRTWVRDVDSKQPIAEINTLEQLLSETVSSRAGSTFLLSIFATLTLILATLGLYGVIAYSVGQRTQEVGIRVALGARQFEILQLIVSDGFRLALLGVAAGLLLAFALTRVLASYLYNVSTTDVATYLSAVLVLLAVAVVASYLPARRAARTDVVVTLRAE